MVVPKNPLTPPHRGQNVGHLFTYTTNAARCCANTNCKQTYGIGQCTSII